MQMKKISDPFRKFVLAVLILCQLCICVYFGHLKRGFFCDEIYSYGLANNVDYTFIDYESVHAEGKNGWVNNKFFINYVTVQEDTGYSIKGAIENQEKDVHPPLYYILLYTVNYFNKGNFSKWSGIGLNLCILLAIDLLLYYVANYFLKSQIKSILAIALWSCSAAGLSNILFIRMYLLLTGEIIAYVAIHIWGRTGKNRLPFLAMIFFGVVIGGLTHYYYYLFVFFFSAPICLAFLCRRKIKDFFAYAGTLMAAFFTNLLIFPATIEHVFSGYRGQQTFENLENRTGSVFLDTYLTWIDKSQFGGMLKIVIAIIIITFLRRLWVKYFRIAFSSEEETYSISIKRKEIVPAKEFVFKICNSDRLFLLTMFAVAMFVFISTQGSELESNRYIYPIYPFLAVVFILVLSWIGKQWGVTRSRTICGILTVVVSAVCVASVGTYKIDYQYPDYDIAAEKVSAVQGDDCLLYYDYEKFWLDVYTALPLKFNYDETFFFRDEDIPNLNEILKERNTDDPVVICLPDWFSEEEAQELLTKLQETCGWNGYDYIYHYYTQAYLVHE